MIGDRAVRPASGPIVGWRERAASNRRDAERHEIPAAGEDPCHGLPLAALRQVESCGRPRESAVEERRLRLEFFPHRKAPGDTGLSPGDGGVGGDRHEPMRVGYGERTQEKAVDDPKDRRVRANAQRERERNRRGEPRDRRTIRRASLTSCHTLSSDPAHTPDCFEFDMTRSSLRLVAPVRPWLIILIH